MEPDSPVFTSNVATGLRGVVPRLMKFSGVLTDVEGKPINGSVDVTFTLYDSESGDEPLWFETQNVQCNELGRYTVLLGAMHTEGLPIDLFTSGQAQWLSIHARSGIEQPRVLLVSVPYALKAGDADTLGGKPASAYVLADSRNSSTLRGKSGNNQTKTSSTIVAPLASTCSGINSNAGGAQNSIAMFGGACDIESSNINQAGGMVGIGTTSPTSALDITSPSNASVQLSGPGTHQFTAAGVTSGRVGQDAAGFFLSSDTKGAPLRFATNNGVSNEWMRITSVGNVGIGTTAPISRLDVGGSTPITWTFGANNQGLVTIGSPGIGGSLYVNTPSPNTSYQSGFAVDGSYGAPLQQSVINLRALGVKSGGGYGSQMAFWTSNGTSMNPAMLLDQSGQLGIGTATPSKTLDVRGNARVAAGDPSTTGEIVFMRDDLDRVHIATYEAGQQMHFRLSRANSVNGAQDFLIGPYTYGMEIDYRGVLEINSNVLSVKGFPGTGTTGNIYLDTLVDSGSLLMRGDTSGPTITATHYNNTSSGSITFAVINPTDSFKFGTCTSGCSSDIDNAGRYTTPFIVSATGAVTIGGGTPITEHISATATLSFPVFAAFSCVDRTIGVPGAEDGDSVALGIPGGLAALPGVTWSGWVGGIGLVTVRGCNATAMATGTPPSAKVRADVWKH